MLGDIVCNYAQLLQPWNFINQRNLEKRLELNTLKFSVLSNFVALLGGKIKSKQMISGNMADVLSNLYLSYALLWTHHSYHLGNADFKMIRDECLLHLNIELEHKMNLIISNYPNTMIRRLMAPLKSSVSYQIFENKNKLYDTILLNKDVQNVFKQDIYYEDTVLEKMEKLNELIVGSEKYDELYQNIISVGEFNTRM